MTTYQKISAIVRKWWKKHNGTKPINRYFRIGQIDLAEAAFEAGREAEREARAELAKSRGNHDLYHAIRKRGRQ